MNTGPRLPVHPSSQSALPDISLALPWRDWSAGLAEAARRQVPILVLAEPSWANSVHRLGWVLSQGDWLRTLLTERLVPILLDPVQRPDLVAQWRWASVALTGTNGPPLMLLLTHEGLPFLTYCSMWPEGRAPFPSLAALAHSTADAYERDPAAFVQEARALQVLPARDATIAHRSPQSLWHALAAETDATHGGFQESPKHPHPQLLWLLLELHQRGDAPDIRAFVRTTLQAMVRGGINDQLGEGFHRCARDERWVVPHFEKPLPLNAQLAALYAKAAAEFEDDGFRRAANELAAFCSTGLREGVDAVGSDSHYYTWTSREVLDHLDPGLVQAVSFYYHLTPDASRQVLYRALEPEAMDRYSHEAPETLRWRIAKGRRQMRAVRSQRPAPELVRLPALSWTAQSLCWLFRAAEQGAAVAIGELESYLERLTADRFQPGRGYPRTDGGGDTPLAWLEDQAAILAAMLACARARQSERWRERAHALADVILDRYGDEQGWRDQPGERGSTPRSWAVTDDVLPSAIATLTDALDELGQVLGECRYRDIARTRAARHIPSLQPCAQRAGAMWRAWFRLSEADG